MHQQLAQPTDDTAAGGDRAGRRRRRWIVAAAVGGVVLVVIALTSLPGNRRALIDPAGREPVTGVTTVEVRDDVWEYFAFTPSVIEVEAGTEVTWEFTSGTEHNVVFADGPDSPLLSQGDRWSRSFDAPGDYAYVCTLHEGMDGRVVVTPAGG